MANDSIIIKKKKVVGHGGHHGGSWKVAYADFVTAMMAFFMVLWIMGLSDDTKASIQGYFNDPAGFMKNPPHTKEVIKMVGNSTARPDRTKPQGNGTSPSDGIDGIRKDDDAERKAIQDAVKERTGAFPTMKNIEVSSTQEGIQIEFMEDVESVFFETGSATISPLGKKVIKSIEPLLSYTGRYIVLEGHTDRQAYAGKEYTNWELSTQRASAFRKELALDGIPEKRFKEVRGFADTRLKFPGKPYAPGNRRVALLLPWGKTAAPPNAKFMSNAKTRASIGFGGDKPINLLAPTAQGPHL